MSAYICSPEHFSALAAFAVRRRNQSGAVISEWSHEGDPVKTARRVAAELARENIRSVATRYPGDRELPGPADISTAEIIREAADYAESYYFKMPDLSPVDILKMCEGYSYQSCESENWRDTLAHRQINWIRGEAISMLTGYDAAPWAYDGDGRVLSRAPVLISLRR